jgi:GT2 family glycosyltransferase
MTEIRAAGTAPDRQTTDADLSVIIVSYNTREMTLKAVETLYTNTQTTRFNCIVLDNASEDGSAEAVAEAFPMVQVIASQKNHGFALANNIAAEQIDTPYILLLNPDTETYPGAIDALMDFARGNPGGGIWGGRTVFPAGTLNIASCWARPTMRSLFFRAFGLTTIFPKREFFNPEAYGTWRRDSVREVDIVVGCFLLITRELWSELEGFNLKYFMYGEDADLCLRARAKGWRPMITPQAQIMHVVGASSKKNDRKAVMVMKSRAALVKDHWPRWQVPIGIFLMWLWCWLRLLATRPFARSGNAGRRQSAERWKYLWDHRADWLSGY